MARSARHGGFLNSSILKTISLVPIAAVFCLALRADASDSFGGDSASEWANSYWLDVPDSTMSMQLVITPESHFKLIMGGCFGNDEVAHGKVTYRDDVLLLHPEIPTPQDFVLVSRAMIPVNWKDRLYLIGANRIGEFLTATREEPETCRGFCQGFFVRESDLPQ